MDFRTRRHRRGEAELDMTPLIDVVFLLLIFFLVTATTAQNDAQHDAQSNVPIDLPGGATGEAAAADERITVHLQADGTVTVEVAGTEPLGTTDIAELLELLTTAHVDEPNTPVYLRGDREVPYGRVMEVLDAARRVGFQQVYNVVYAAPE